MVLIVKINQHWRELTAYSVVSEVHRKRLRDLSKRNEEPFSDFEEKKLMMMSKAYEKRAK